MEKPTQPTGRKQHLSPPFKRQSLLEVSEIDRGNASNVSKPRLPSVHLSPLRWGDGQAEESASQTQASAVLQQSEANLALGFQGRMKGVMTGRSLVRGTASRATTRQFQMTQQRGYIGHGSDLSHSQLSCLEAGGAVHATQSRDRF